MAIYHRAILDTPTGAARCRCSQRRRRSDVERPDGLDSQRRRPRNVESFFAPRLQTRLASYGLLVARCYA